LKIFKVAFGELTVEKTRVFKLFFNFKSSVTSLKDAESTGKTNGNVHLAEEHVIKNSSHCQ